MLSSYSSIETIPNRSASPREEGRHPQFPNFPAKIDGQVVANSPRKNQFWEPKRIPYAVPIYEPRMPSWSSCEYSSTPTILSIEEEVVYPWEIDVPASRITDV